VKHAFVLRCADPVFSVFGSDQSQVLGNIIFNYAFVTTVPSWVNEKVKANVLSIQQANLNQRKDVSANTSIWASTAISTLLYAVIGLLGGLAFSFDSQQDFLDGLDTETAGGALHVISSICVYLFPAVACLTSVSVYSIVSRYNLLESRICRKGTANFWAVIFPWIVAVAFYNGAGLLNVVNWTSLVVSGTVNFIIPIVIFMVAFRKNKGEFAAEVAC